MVDDLLRAGPAAVRTALQTDKTLVSFLDASAFARLADYARSCHPPAAKLKPGVDVLKVMNANPWHWRIAEGLFQVLVIIIMATAIVWPTWRGLLHLATD